MNTPPAALGRNSDKVLRSAASSGESVAAAVIQALENTGADAQPSKYEVNTLNSLLKSILLF
jgi:hypothetical protein